MIPHSLITLAWMAGALALHAIFGLTPWFAAVGIVCAWWSREQYVAELDRRKAGMVGWPHVLPTLVSMFDPRNPKNRDFLVPAGIAFAAAAIGPAVMS